MREELVEFLLCPRSGSSLRLEVDERDGAEVIRGRLVSGAGDVYPIEGGICRLLPDRIGASEEATAKAFGREWKTFDDHGDFMAGEELFMAFAAPLKPEDFRGKTVLEVGCGGGRWLSICERFGARAVVGLDFSRAVEQSRQRNLSKQNVHVVQGSLYANPLKPVFDIVLCIGVLHHLREPCEGMKALVKAVKPGGRVVLWTYSKEGNELYLKLARPLRRLTTRLPHSGLLAVALPLAVLVWGYVKVFRPLLCLLGLHGPMAAYFGLISRLTFRDLWSVVYDQLAPQLAVYPSREEILQWVDESGGGLLELGMRTGNSWRVHLSRPCHENE